ncbi:hypothetical protein [Fimbriiglobus ruber]|uniref:hypothetical protein n=1 Tax=Fimbriiglobus ruber TaxID=1908690 RepID=UPI001EE71448|nr:hypothetical protein [Fimbriiglobus ruber]
MTEDEWLDCNEPLKLVQFGDDQPNPLRFGHLAADWAGRIRQHFYSRDLLWFDAFVEWIHGTGVYPNVRNFSDDFDYFPSNIPLPSWIVNRENCIECLQTGRLSEAAAYAVESIAEGNPDFVEMVNFDKEHRGRSAKKRHAEEVLREARRQAWQAERVATAERVRREFCAHYRDIVGNPFRPVALEPHWQTSTVLSLAKGIYNDRAFDRLPILADALEEAACYNPGLLTHCRSDATHVRGCWVVDLLLGKK